MDTVRRVRRQGHPSCIRGVLEIRLTLTNVPSPEAQTNLVSRPVFPPQPADKKKFPYGSLNTGRPLTPPRGAANQKNKKK